MRIFRHTLVHRLVAAASDEVVGFCPIPSESRLNHVWGEVHLMATGGVDLQSVSMYGADGRVIPDDDPGDATLLDLEWDLNVSKDQDVSAGAFSMDPGSSESSPMFEPGEPSMEALMGLALQNKEEFFKRRKMVSFMTIPRGFEVGTPDLYIPGDVFKINAGRRIEADRMSHAVLVISNPALDDTTTTAPTTFSTEAKWMQLKYLEVVLEQSWMQLMGIGGEAGAETPWEEAALLVEEVLEPTVIEETANKFLSLSWNVYAMMTFDITVPGGRNFKTLTAA